MAATPKKNAVNATTLAQATKKRRSILATALVVAAVSTVVLVSLVLSRSGDDDVASKAAATVASTPESQTNTCELKQCKIGGSEVCGTDGKTYLNECYFQNAQCRTPTLDRVADWKGYNCPNKCTKHIACSEVGVHLCASDGNVYFGYCNLYIAQCLDPSITQVECDKAIFAKDK